MKTSALKATTEPLRLSVDPVRQTCQTMPHGCRPTDFDEIDDGSISLLLHEDVAVGFRASLAHDLELVNGEAQPRFLVTCLSAEPLTPDVICMMAGGMFGDYGTPDTMLERAARAQLQAGQFDQALQAAVWCVATGHPDGQLLLGEVLLAAGRPVSAYGHLRAYATGRPEDPLGWLKLGEACEGRGDGPEARRAYVRALEIAPLGRWADVAISALDRVPARTLWEEPWR